MEFGQIDQLMSHELLALTPTHLMMMNKYRPMPQSMNMQEDLYSASQMNIYSKNILGQFAAAGHQDELDGIDQINMQ